MRKELTLNDGRTLALSANAATPIRYKMTFGTDLLKELGSIEEDKTSLPDITGQMAYVMNMQAQGDVESLSLENYLIWLEEFEDPMIFTNLSKDIMNFYLSNVKTGSKAKNAKGPRTGK